MEGWAIPIALLIVHALMFVAVVVNVLESLDRTRLKKALFILVALLVPIVGPIYINFRLGVKPRKNAGLGNISSSQLSEESMAELREWSESKAHSVGGSSSGSDFSGSDSGGGGGD